MTDDFTALHVLIPSQNSGPSGTSSVPIMDGLESMLMSPALPSASTEDIGCTNCAKLQEEIVQLQKREDFYVDIKKKISLTDSLIKKYQVKCQENDDQQQKMDELAHKLSVSKRDYKTLENELTNTLKEILPYKMDKEKFVARFKELEQLQENTRLKLDASEALCKQYQVKVTEFDDSYNGLQGEVQQLKDALDLARNKEKKIAPSLERTKLDLAKTRNALIRTRKQKLKLLKKTSRLQEILQEVVRNSNLGSFAVPRVPSYLMTSVSMEDDDDDDDLDNDGDDDGDNDDQGNDEDGKILEENNDYREANVGLVGIKEGRKDGGAETQKVQDNFSDMDNMDTSSEEDDDVEETPFKPTQQIADIKESNCKEATSKDNTSVIQLESSDDEDGGNLSDYATQIDAHLTSLPSETNLRQAPLRKMQPILSTEDIGQDKIKDELDENLNESKETEDYRNENLKSPKKKKVPTATLR